MPGQAAHSGHRFELVNNSSGNEVDVVVVQLDAGVSDPLSSELVQLGVINPLNTLKAPTKQSFTSVVGS